jgi:hypothetical protein
MVSSGGCRAGAESIPSSSPIIKHGGWAAALATAQRYYPKLLRKLGLPKQNSRRWSTAIRRRKGSCSIVRVQRIMVWRCGRVRKYWQATWSLEPYVVTRKVCSVQSLGFRKARQLAIRERAGQASEACHRQQLNTAPPSPAHAGKGKSTVYSIWRFRAPGLARAGWTV